VFLFSWLLPAADTDLVLVAPVWQQAATAESPFLWQSFVRRDFGRWAEPARSIIDVEVGVVDWWRSQYRSLLGRHENIANTNRRVETVGGWAKTGGLLAERHCVCVVCLFLQGL
jgi:hypothetical protein